MKCIDRQQAIDKITARYPDSDATQYSIGYADAINDVLKDIRYMPSAEPERKTGQWIFKKIFPEDKSEFPVGYLVCSNCGSHHANAEPLKYCDNCGWKMEVE